MTADDGERLPAWVSWLTEPIDRGHQPIRLDLIGTLHGSRRMITFGASCIVLLATCYALTYGFRVGYGLLVVASAVIVWRLASVAGKAPAAAVGDTLISGLCWAAVIGLTGGAGALTGRIMLTTLAGVVMTGLAFGAAFANAGAPRFAKIQIVLMLLPFTALVGVSGPTEMFVISAQIPLWIAGIFGVIGDSHMARANLIQAQRLNGYLAYHDVLTGLANRAQILQRLEAECFRSARVAGSSIYVLYLDLDGFKAVNDRFGHASGDDLLRAVASRFQAHIRPSDLLGRLGGDEFAAVLTAMAPDQIRLVANRLIDAGKEPFLFDGLPPIHIGVSIGGASLSTPPDVRRTLEAADRMLYAAKQAGKGIVRLE